MKKNLYGAIREDTNHDGYLSSDDREDFYVSDYNGRNLKLVLEDATGWQVIRDNTVFITQGKREAHKFYIYDVVADELKSTNVGLSELTTIP